MILHPERSLFCIGCLVFGYVDGRKLIDPWDNEQ